jgi:ubiquinone/menaquinone biosynthesis C-methylase UbiE
MFFSILHSQFYIRLVAWAFERFYREFAWTYDAVAAAVSGGCWRAWGRTTLPYLSGRVLELGCGTGNLQLALAQASSVGVDASAQMIGITARKLARDGRPAALVRAQAQSLPFSPGIFDTIVSTFPSGYIVDPATMSEARRVLRPGGRVVIALSALFRRDGLYERLVGLAYRLTLQRSPRPGQLETPRSLAGERLAQAGFAVAERWEPAGDDHVHLVIGTRI